MLALLAACQHGAGPARHARAQASPVVVASFNFPESELLAAIYGLALRHAGIPIQFRLDLGPRELVEPALEQGLVGLVPEYLGTALTSIEPHPSGTMTDPAAVRAALARAFAAWNVAVLTPARAQDQNGVAVTRATDGTAAPAHRERLAARRGQPGPGRPPGMPVPAVLPARAAQRLRPAVRPVPAVRHRAAAGHRAEGWCGQRRGAVHYRREPGGREPGPAHRQPSPAARGERRAGGHGAGPRALR